MPRGSKRTNGRAGARRPTPRPSRRAVRLQTPPTDQQLIEALEQQAATSEILQVIRRSPNDAQPIFDMIAERAMRLCGALHGGVFTFDGALVHIAAHVYVSPEFLEAVQRTYPRPPGRGTASARVILTRATVHIPDLEADPDYEFTETAKTAGFRSVLSVPMLRDGEAIGAITVFRGEAAPFSDSHVRLLQTFADQAVIAIENVRLFTELGARNRALTESLEQQTATGDILKVISSSPTDVQPVFDIIAESAVRLCGALMSCVFRFDGELIHFVGHHNFSPEGLAVYQRTYPLTPTQDKLLGQALRQRRPINVADILTEYRSPIGQPELGFRSVLAVPIVREGVAIGAIAASRLETGEFPATQVALLQTFAAQAVIAIENVRLFTELESRNRDLTETLEQQTATGEILKVISSSPTNVQPVFDIIAKSAVTLCGAEVSAVTRFDGELVHLDAVYGSNPEGVAALRRAFPMRSGSGGGAARAIHARALIHIADVLADPEYRIQEAAIAGGFRGLMGMPMLRDGRAIGAITVGRTAPGLFSDSQVQLLRTFAEQALIAIENVRLFTELGARNRDLTEALEQQTATSDILKVISSSPTDVQPVFETIAEHAVRLCGAEVSTVTRFDGALVHLDAIYGSSQEGVEALRRAFPMRASAASGAARAIYERAIIHVPDVLTDPEYRIQGAAIAGGFRALMGVPMLRDGRAIGAITVGRAAPGRFSDTQVQLLATFAEQALIAIENVRLFTELETRNTQLTESLEQQTATAEILSAISSSPTDIRPVLDTVVRAAARFCGAPDVAIVRLNGEVVWGAASVGPFGEELAARSGGIEGLRYPLTRGSVSGRAIIERRSVHVHDLATEPEDEFPVGRDLQRRYGHHTILATPLLREGLPLGAIMLFRTETRPFSDRQLELAKIFADQAVIAIENVRLFQELQARNGALSEALEQQTATGEVLKIISRSTVDLEPVLETVVESATRLCGAVRGHIFRLDGDCLRFAAAYGAWPGFQEYLEQNPVRIGPDSASGRAAAERRPVHIHDIRQDPCYGYGELVKRQDYRTVLAVPILREDALLGVIAILKSNVEPFTDKQIELVTTFADQAAIAIENVRLLTELQARNRALTESLEQQTATSDILRVISSSPTDAQPVFDIIAERATKLCDAEVAVVSRFDGTLLQLAAIHGVTREGLEAVRRLFPQPIDFDNLTARAFRERAVVHVADVLADQTYAMKGEALTAGWRSGLAAPMFRDGQVIGVIFVGRSTPGLFSDQRVELLKTFADQAVIAIENVRLFRELEVRNRDLTETLEQQTATSDILRVISSSPTDVQPVFDAVAESAARLCESFDAAIWRRDGDRLLLVAHHGPIPIGPVGEFTLSIGGTAAGRTILNGRTEQVADIQQEASEFPESSAHAQRMGFRTVLCVPLIREGTAIGAISLRRTEVHLFADRQVALLQTFADQAVIAIENVRLFRELEVRNRDLTETLEQQTATSHILGVISSSPTDVQPVFDTIAQNARALCAADSGSVFIFDGQMIHLEALDNANPDQAAALRLAYPMVANRGHATGRAVLTGMPTHIADVRVDPEYTLTGLRDNAGLRSLLSVPMIREGRPIGAITVQRWGSVRPFSDKQIALLETFAAQAVIAIQNVRLFDELEVRNRDLTESLDQQTATGEILRVISSSPTDVQPVFETIARNARRLCNADSGAVYTYDGRLIHLHALDNTSPEGSEALRRAYPTEATQGSASGQAILTCREVHIPDALTVEGYEMRGLLGAGLRSLLAVPMLRGGTPVGVIVVHTWEEPRPFTTAQIELLRTFADQAVIAIENTRLFQELQVRNRDLTESLDQQTATGEILRVISSTPTDVQPVFDTIVESAVRLCNGLFSALFRYDGELIYQVAQHNFTPEALEHVRRIYPQRPSRDTGSARTILTREVVHIPDVEADPDYRAHEMTRAVGLRSGLYVPMMKDGEPIGAIMVARAEPGPFSEAHIGLLKTFADQAVIAIENVRLFTALDARNRDLTESLEQQTATGEILRVISSSPTDAQPVFDTIARAVLRLCGAELCQVFQVDEGMMHFVGSQGHTPEGLAAAQRAFPRPVDRGTTAGRAILSAAIAQIEDVRTDAEYAVGEVARAMNFRALVAVPMIREGRAIGAISVARHEPGRFTDRQMELLRVFADQAVIAVENVRLFKELDARNRDLTNALEQQTATADVLRVMSGSATDTQPVFDAIVRSAVRLCHARFALVYRLEDEIIQFAAHANLPAEAMELFKDSFPQRLSDSRTLVGRAIRGGQVVNVADIAADSQVSEFVRELARSSGYRSVLAVPIMREGRPLGALAIMRSGPAGEPDPFLSDEIPLLQTFTDQAGIAIENVRLFNELQARTAELTRSVGELQALGEVSQAVSSTLDLDAVLETIVARAVQLSGSDQGVVYEFDEASQTFHQRATHRMAPDYVETMRAAPIRLGEGAIGRAGVTRTPVQLADIRADWELVAPQARERLVAQGMQSLLAVPLVREDRLLGGLVIIRRERGVFSLAVVATLQTFATQSVLAIQNARLFQEIQRQKRYSDTLVETSPVAIVTMDLGGIVVGWNPGAERLFGYPSAEALDHPMWELIASPELREEVRANIRDILEGQLIRAIGRRARKDGTMVDVEISAMPVVVGGAKVGMIAIYHDVTELLQAREEAEAANEAKSAFLATMSHEIRTPMNAVIGMSGLLLNTALTDEQREYAEVVRQSGDALLTVINDILDFSKIEAGRLELESQPFDLRECVEGALDLVATRAAEKGLDLAYLLGDGMPAAIVGDVTRLRQVLLNLLSNAVKFTETGEVVLSVGAHRPDGADRPYELSFSVRDTGIGIPPDRLDRLFQSFSQIDASTTRRYGGTGLGLAISQRLTELMGGRIKVTSEVGRGSEFHFTIRAHAGEAPLRTRRDLSGVQPSLRDKRVLVVDDNATNRRILTTYLATWGMPARATGSPNEALAWIRADERFDVGILDMHMPEMDGVALARAIVEHPSAATLPLVLFTSLGRREALADNASFAAYLHKPIKPSQLFDALVSVLAEQPVHVAPRAAGRSELDPGMAARLPLRILLAEDNVVNQKLALRLLAQMGYRADLAGNGLEALDAVERQTYDVVLMDVQMPEMDGLEASREINQRWTRETRPRIIAMTANAMQGDRELCMAAGMDDYVAKPIRVEELVAALERCRPAGDGGHGTMGTADGTDGGEQSPIDRAAFDRLIETMGGAFVGELIETFGQDAVELIATLRRTLAAADVDGFRRAAHSLKSTSQSLGANGLAARARELESAARAGNVEGAGDRVQALAEHYEAVARILGAIRRDLPA